MCARFTLGKETAQIKERFQLAGQVPPVPARYNQAPGQLAAVITGGGRRGLAFFRWGLVPHWAKDPKIGYKLINARAETAAEKPSFREALAKRRCLVPADGFYEWRARGKSRQPFRFTLAEGGLFAFAGLWESWGGGSEALFTFTILTTRANSLVAGVHDRMPVILATEFEDPWLAGGELDPAFTGLALAPFPAGKMAMQAVSGRVNSPANEGPDLIEAVALPGELF